MNVQETFAVPVTSGNYAPETITFSHPIRRFVLIVLAYVTDATVEVDVLDEDGETWHTALASATAAGIYEIADFAEAVVQVRVRAKSGGTSGNLKVKAIGSRRPS